MTTLETAEPQAATQAGKYLTFILDGEGYGLPVRQVLEIIRCIDITSVSNMARHILGVTNLRGSIVPVLDLRMIFDLPDTTITDKTCTVVIQVPTATGRLTTIGLMVDRVTEVVLVEDEQIEKPSDFGEQRESGRDFAVARINGVIVSLIDLSQVLHQELSAIT